MAKTLKEKVEELVTPKKEKVVKEEEVVVVDGYDPDMPENKQRWLR